MTDDDLDASLAFSRQLHQAARRGTVIAEATDTTEAQTPVAQAFDDLKRARAAGDDAWPA